MRGSFLTSLFALIFLACHQESNDLSLGLTNEQIKLINALGLNPQNIEYLDQNNIVVEKDIVVSTTTLREMLQQQKESKNQALNRQNAVLKTSAIDYKKTGTIKYYLSEGFSPIEKAAIKDGFTAWTSTTNNIHFEESPSQDIWDILVFADNNMPHYGFGQFPVGGNPGNAISLNLQLTQNNCAVDYATCVRSLVIHEIGHTLGFSHLGNDEYLIGSPSIDGTSIMNSGINQGWIPAYGHLGSPNANDMDMASSLYPANGLAIALTSVSAFTTQHGEFLSLSLSYTQNFGRCYTAFVEIVQNGIVKQTLSSKDIGVMPSGTIYYPKVLLRIPPGVYQVRAVGRNYKGDFTQSVTSNSLPITI